MGGTYTRIASSLDLSTIYKSVKFNTKKNLINQKNVINYNIRKLSDNGSISAICLGVPGTLDRKKGIFLKFPNYKALENNAFQVLLDPEFHKIPITVVNDAHMAGYMEAIEGAGKDYSIVLYISIGTGIGGAWIRDKKLEDAFFMFEPGHEPVFDDGMDFEKRCSGHNFKRIYGDLTLDKVSKDTWKSYAKELSIGLSFLLNKYPSDVIVLGGGFSINNFQYFDKFLPSDLNIKLVEYGDNSGVLGGLAILSRLDINCF